MHVNLHITLTAFRFESRVLKETLSLVQAGLFGQIYIAALHRKGTDELEEIDESRSVWRIKLHSRNWPRNLFIQLIKYLEFSARLIWYARRKRVTVVTIHSLALLPLGVAIKWVCRGKLVYDCHELETEINGLSGLRQWLARLVERLLIRRANLVLVVSESINTWYREKYGILNVHSVLNCPVFQKPQRTRRLHDELGIRANRRIVLYQGGLLRGRGIEGLLDSFSKLDDERHVLVLMGYGDLSYLVESYAKENDNIFLKKAVHPSVVLDYTASADIGVSYIDNPSLCDHYCLPNKLFEYLMAGLPVIVNNVPEMQRLVEERQVGVVLDELSAASMESALEDIEGRMGAPLYENLKRTAEDFSWSNQAKVLVAGHQQHVFALQVE